MDRWRLILSAAIVVALASIIDWDWERATSSRSTLKPETQIAREPAKPSFDCAAAKTRVETLICNDSELAEADALMAQLYAKVKVSAFGYGPSNEPAVQREWLNERSGCLGRTKAIEIGAAVHDASARNPEWPDSMGSVKFLSYRVFYVTVDSALIATEADLQSNKPGIPMPRRKAISPAQVNAAIADLSAFYQRYRRASTAKAPLLARAMVRNVMNTWETCDDQTLCGEPDHC